jgi:hypothetical protein
MKYDESQDQSERFGWKKVKDEPPLCEKEQRLWGNITVVIGVLMAATTLIIAH